MTKLKTSELTGLALDWAVAKAIGKKVEYYSPLKIVRTKRHFNKFSPSTDWNRCGPLIAEYLQKFEKYGAGDFFADCGGRETCYSAPTPQIAICRAVVAAKLGDEVEIPSELIP